MSTVQSHRLVRDYLRELEQAAHVLPPDEREELVAGIREHVDDALRGVAASDEAGIRNALDRLGEPGEIIAAARGDADALSAPGVQLEGGSAPLVWGIVGLTVLPVIGSVIAILTAARARKRAAAAGLAPPTAVVAGQVLGWVGVAGLLLVALWLYLWMFPFLTGQAIGVTSAMTYMLLGAVAYALPVAGCVAMVVSARSRRRRAVLAGRADPSVRGALGWAGIVVLGLGAGWSVPFLAGGVLAALDAQISSAGDLALGVVGFIGILAVPGVVAVVVGRRARQRATEQETAEPKVASAVEVVGWFVLTVAAATLPWIALLAAAEWGSS